MFVHSPSFPYNLRRTGEFERNSTIAGVFVYSRFLSKADGRTVEQWESIIAATFARNVVPFFEKNLFSKNSGKLEGKLNRDKLIFARSHFTFGSTSVSIQLFIRMRNYSRFDVHQPPLPLPLPRPLLTADSKKGQTESGMWHSIIRVDLGTS